LLASISAPIPKPKPAPHETTRVISAVGMDYRKLRDLLAAKKWKEADQETTRVMLKVAGTEKKGLLDVEDIEKFPCEDLSTIDQLWVKYSDGCFGFSVQKRIYQEAISEYANEGGYWFGDRVSWRKNYQWLYYKDLTFSEKAPKGHLPVMSFDGWSLYLSYLWIWRLNFTKKFVNCNI